MTQAALLGITITLTAALVVLGSLAIFAGLWRPRHQQNIAFAPADQDVVFIFRGHDLIDCSDPARSLLKSLNSSDRGDLGVLLEYLAARFPDVQEKLADLAQSGGVGSHFSSRGQHGACSKLSQRANPVAPDRQFR